MMDSLSQPSDDVVKVVSSTSDFAGTGGLTIIKEHDEEADDIIRKQYENMSYDEMTQRLAENYKQLSDILTIHDITPSSTVSDNTNSMEGDRLHILCDEEDYEVNEQELLESVLEDEVKRTKITKLFWRAASSGDLDKLQHFLQDTKLRSFVDIDAKDEDGTTPLIYAACFGKADVAQALLLAGAKIDIQDSFGWSALMWATNNNHEQLVKIFLEHGASSQTKSSKGRTVFDFVNTDNQKIVDILATNPRDSISSTSSIFGRTAGSLSSSSSNAGDYDFYYQSTVEGYDSFMSEEADRRRKLLESAMQLGALDDNEMDHTPKEDHEINSNNNPSLDTDSSGGNDNGDDDDNDGVDNDDFHLTNEFQWDKCLPDQMFVFGADDLSRILQTVITDIHLPMRSQYEICVPANVIFLSARFAHYFSGDELLNQLLDESLQRMSAMIKSSTRNIHILAFWMTNLTQLLHYLKKDTGLVVATANQQLALSELISETYMTMINDTERRLAKILGPAMLEHDEIPGMDDVNFTDDWHRFFRRSSRRSVVIPTDGALAVQMKRHASTPNATTTSVSNVSNVSSGGDNSNNTNTSHTNNDSNSNNASSNSGKDRKVCRTHVAISPQSITSLLSSTLFVLQSYDVHPTIVIQALAQFFHYLSCELFNRILTNKKLLCRSKAMQIRMNLSQIEDWICANNMPASLSSYLTPTTQLLQLLQCLTQLTDLVSFINTVKTFDVLNALQVKRCVVNYRYEVNEPRLPEEIEKYAMQLAEDTVRHRQSRNHQKDPAPLSSLPRKRHTSMSMSRSQSISMQRGDSRRRESMSHLVGSFMSSMGITTSLESASSLQRQPYQQQQYLPHSPVDMVSPTVKADSSGSGKENCEMDNAGDDDDDDDKEIKETKDSKFMLPFSVPTSTMHTTAAGQPSKREHFVKERPLIPVIPEAWMDILDKGHSSV